MKKISGLLQIVLFTFVLVQIINSQPLNKNNAPAAELQFLCNVQNGFNFQKNGQLLTGFIEYLKIGNTELRQDFNLTDPENNITIKKEVAVIRRAYWVGGYSDPLIFESQVSTDNKNTIADLILRTSSSLPIEFGFCIYSYDVKENKYYKAFTQSGTTIKGSLSKSGGELIWQINMDNSFEVVVPKNYKFIIAIDPAAITQALEYAVSVNDKFSKMWKSNTFGTNINDNKIIPAEFALNQNYPNPFNPETVISYQLPASSFVTLKVYDTLGQEIAIIVNEYQQAGSYNSQFSMSNSQFSSGIYFYQMKAGNFVDTKKMMIVK